MPEADAGMYLRLPRELRDAVRALADREDRSLTRQLVRLIRVGLEAELKRGA